MTYTLDESHTSRNFTPAANVMATFGFPRDIKWITIHHWGNNGQQFNVVRDYLCTNTTPTSAHFVAEDGQVACIVSPLDAAWHAGNAQGNAQSIGIECRPEHTDGDYQTVGELVAWLRTQYGDLPLVPHNYWTSTACPGDYDLNRIDAIARGATVTPQSGTITPITTDWFDMASLDDLANVLKRQDVADAIAARVPYAWFTNKYGRPVQFESLLGQMDLNVNNNHAALTAQVNGVPAAVWNQNIGTGNAAGVVNHIDAKPAVVAAPGTAAAPFDADAFIARLVATLPPAIRADLKNAL